MCERQRAALGLYLLKNIDIGPMFCMISALTGDNCKGRWFLYEYCSSDISETLNKDSVKAQVVLLFCNALCF